MQPAGDGGAHDLPAVPDRHAVPQPTGGSGT